MTTKNKAGLVIVSVSGLGFAYVLALFAYRYLADGGAAWGIATSVFVAGVAFVIWGLKDLRTHQKNACQKDNKVDNAPDYNRTK